jgi:HAD superfamily hydrolase (TIGR01484 family)
MDIHYQVFFPPRDRPWEALLIERQRPESEMYRRHTGIVPVVADLKAVLAEPGTKGCFKAMFICDPCLHDELRRKMGERFGDSIYMARSFPTFLEIMNAGVSKGDGLKTAMKCRGLKMEELIAFGDEENDLPMFGVAGFSAAPSSAKEKIRQAADFVFGSNAEEGLAVFLENLFK